MAKGRSNLIIKQKRIRQVMDLMGKGLYTNDIVYTLMEDWKCSKRAVYCYIDIVKNILSKEINSLDTNKILGRFDYLYQEAIKTKDNKLANLVNANIAKYTIGDKLRVDGELTISQININVINGTQSTSN